MNVRTLTTGMVLMLSALPAAAAPLAEHLDRPLILGASVSAGFGTLGPADRLARRFTNARDIVNVARSGTPARDQAGQFTEALFRDRSAVIAIDLMFWDSALPDPTRSLETLDLVLAHAAARNVPVVLGDIPALLPERQVSRARLNAAIHQKCQAAPRCSVLRLDDLHQRVMRDRSLEIKGRRYAFPELLPDGLHLAEIASEFLADQIAAVPVLNK